VRLAEAFGAPAEDVLRLVGYRVRERPIVAVGPPGSALGAARERRRGAREGSPA
jgi:hypothetical protein